MKTDTEVKKSKNNTVKQKKLKMVWIYVITFFVLIVALISANIVANRNFEVSFYNLKSEKVSDNIRIVELADLHDAEFGNNNSQLIKKIESLHPDLLFYCGDMINCGDDDYSVLYNLSDKLSKIAPIYACFGNNEFQQYLSNDRQFKKKMSDHGVNLLSNEAVEIEVRSSKIQLIAVSEGVDQFDVETNNAKKFVENLKPTTDMRMCLCHYPEMFNEKLVDRGIDIAFAGHAHGGLVRIPYVGGLFSPGQGIFPKLTQGVNRINDDTTVVISRGLGNSKYLPRINNRPELVVVDINWY